MGKLGKKARKFAKKHLQSVLKRRRKTKALFKKRSSKGAQNTEEQVDDQMEISNGSTFPAGVTDVESRVTVHSSLEDVFAENGKDEVADASDSDGYLTEDSSCPYIVENGTDKSLEDEIASTAYSSQNEKISSDLAIQMKKLKRLTRKDPAFSKFLETYTDRAGTMQNEDLFSDQDAMDQDEPGESDMTIDKWKPLTCSTINNWGQMIRENHSQSAFINLLNAYRSSCHYGDGSHGHKIENRKTFCSIVIFMLSNANEMFQGMMQLSSLNCTKETLLELKKSSKWEGLKPLVKSYVRSTLFLLNQVNDAEILAFAMMRLRPSLIFFAVLPSLVKRLLKVSVHLWATGGVVLSKSSFFVMHDVVAMLDSNYFNICLSKAVVAYMSQSRTIEISDIKHMQFLRDSIIDLCSLDVHKSSLKAAASISQLFKILQVGMQTKRKETLKKICSWEYVNCIDLWVMFISTNIRIHDVHSLLFMSIQLINVLAHMFPGPRYFPLRLKCIEWLNSLSGSSGTFIPLASLLLDVLEYKVVKENGKAQNTFNIAAVLKLPKYYVKSKQFQEECLLSAIEQLSLHFSHWSYHISFPDLASIPQIRLRKFHETTTSENLRRMVKHLIDQVEQNVNFVQKKRDEVSFSPHNHQYVESFLQDEKPCLNASFTNYYKSVQEKAAERRARVKMER